MLILVEKTLALPSNHSDYTVNNKYWEDVERFYLIRAENDPHPVLL